MQLSPRADPYLAWPVPAAECRRRGDALLGLARRAIELRLGKRPAPARSAEARGPVGWEPWLLERGAVFVTLLQGHTLRGCVGSLEPLRRLVDDVRTNAEKAAFGDRRFAPLSVSELPEIRLELSVLSPLERLASADAATIRRTARPGIDGLLISWRGRRSTFLPQVWSSLSDPGDFLAALKEKAGLDPDFEHEELIACRYQVMSFEESERAP